MAKNTFSLVTFLWYAFGVWELFVLFSTCFSFTVSFTAPPVKSSVPTNQDIPDNGHFSENAFRSIATDTIEAALFFMAVCLLAYCVGQCITLFWQFTLLSQLAKVQDKNALAQLVYQGVLYRRKHPDDEEGVGPVIRLLICQCLYLPVLLMYNVGTASEIFKRCHDGNNTTATNHALLDCCRETYQVNSLGLLAASFKLLLVTLVLNFVALIPLIVLETALAYSARMRERFLRFLCVDPDVARSLSTKLDLRATQVLFLLDRNDIIPDLNSLFSQSDVKV